MDGMEARFIADLLATILPFFLVMRWRGGGFILCVLLGWGVVHVANINTPVREPADAIIKGIWACLGWAYMIAWCLFAAMCILLTRFVVKLIKTRFRTDAC
jgi:hypothetical protein